jgi:hypothetical protein
MLFSLRRIDFLIHLLKNKTTTFKSQKILSRADYYLMTWDLRDNGIIQVLGVNRGNEKIWSLTPKGILIAKECGELKKNYENIQRIEAKISGLME